jgi:TolB-like protein
MKNFLEELKERNFWRTLVAYPSVAFVLLQVVEFFINNYDLDARYLTATFIACAGFFPVALVWNWFHGESGSQSFRKMEIGAYMLFTVISVSSVSWYMMTTEAELPSINTATEPARSIAVMPFLNPGEDAAVQYLCDGIAESLINWLAAQHDIKVTSKSSSFRLREEANDPVGLGDRLGVDSVLQGRLEKIGDQIIISASLVDTRDGSQIWGDRLMRPNNELLYLERNIVDAITAGLSLNVTNPVSDRAASGGTNNPQAYQHYLRGHYLIQATARESIDEGLVELRSAIRLDPAFGLPYADIADALIQKIYYSIDRSPVLLGEARTAALSAVALAPGLPEAHTAMAGIQVYFDFDWRAGEQAYQQAIDLKPNSPVPFHRYSDFLWLTLRLDRAIEMAHKAIAQDPLDSSSLHAVGIANLMAGHTEIAAEAFGEWNQFHPQSRWSYVKYALALSLSNRCDLAMERLAVVEQLNNGRVSPLLESWMALSFNACNEKALLEQSLQRIELDFAEDGIGDPAAMIWLYLISGEIDPVIEIMAEMLESDSVYVSFFQFFGVDRFGLQASNELASHPRYVEMVTQLDFPREIQELE